VEKGCLVAAEFGHGAEHASRAEFAELCNRNAEARGEFAVIGEPLRRVRAQLGQVTGRAAKHAVLGRA